MRPLRPPHAGASYIPRKNARDRDAEELAAAFLAYLAGRTDLMLRFFDLTGLSPQTLREAAGRSDFTQNLLHYLGSDDRLLLAFAAETERDPAEIEAIRLSVLPPEHGDA